MNSAFGFREPALEKRTVNDILGMAVPELGFMGNNKPLTCTPQIYYRRDCRALCRFPSVPDARNFFAIDAAAAAAAANSFGGREEEERL